MITAPRLDYPNVPPHIRRIDRNRCFPWINHLRPKWQCPGAFSNGSCRSFPLINTICRHGEVTGYRSIMQQAISATLNDKAICAILPEHRLRLPDILCLLLIFGANTRFLTANQQIYLHVRFLEKWMKLAFPNTSFSIWIIVSLILHSDSSGDLVKHRVAQAHISKAMETKHYHGAGISSVSNECAHAHLLMEKNLHSCFMFDIGRCQHSIAAAHRSYQWVY